MARNAWTLRSLWLIAVVAAAISVGVGAASGVSKPVLADCPSLAMSKPFVPWLDLGSYFLGPSGSFEDTLAGWKVRGGARIVPGNEPFHVHAASDTHALSLPQGSSVTSPSICVRLDSPDLRLFVRNTGSLLSLLRVDLTFTNPFGRPITIPVALLPAGSVWSPSLPVLFLEDVVPLVGGKGQTWVSFTFTPVGAGGKWQVDDFYVDPIKHV
jgi:hypothetical protein